MKNILVETIKTVDELGNRHTLSVWQEFIDGKSIRGDSWIPGMKRVYDQHKRKINVLDDNEFLIVATNTKLKKL